MYRKLETPSSANANPASMSKLASLSPLQAPIGGIGDDCWEKIGFAKSKGIAIANAENQGI
jgi:hypothetical protein